MLCHAAFLKPVQISLAILHSTTYRVRASTHVHPAFFTEALMADSAALRPGSCAMDLPKHLDRHF